MKQSIFRNGLCVGLLAVFLKSLTALGQMPDAGGVNSAMIKLFGDNPTFTAQADVRVMNSNRVVWLQMPSVFACTDTKFRVDVDMKLIKSTQLQASTINTFTKLGMDRVTSVIRPDKKATYIIYPGAQSYASMPLSNEDAQVAGQKVEKKLLGRETLDGHACAKNLSVVKNSKGTVLIQATTWNATDLKDFPIQIETKESGNTTVMHFQNVNLAKPDAKLFDLPTGYKQYSNPQDLMTAALKKAAGPAPPGGAPSGSVKKK
jgi:hypothetical protein